MTKGTVEEEMNDVRLLIIYDDNFTYMLNEIFFDNKLLKVLKISKISCKLHKNYYKILQNPIWFLKAKTHLCT